MDEVVELGGQEWLFVDTARGDPATGERGERTRVLRSARTQRAIERAEVALVVINTSRDDLQQDIPHWRVQMVVWGRLGRALVGGLSKSVGPDR